MDYVDSANKGEPIAIIGIGCRFPGDANCPETFWRLLINGVDAIAEVPADRFDINAFYDPDRTKPGKVITRYGGFLRDIDKFDPNFFAIAPREAECMDPQQRLLLEVAFEALEDAGQPLETVSGSRTGVFIGIYSSDYEHRMFADLSGVDLYVATGSALYSAAGRLSYVFNLQGPSMAIGTACSSSLVSTHLAVRSLRSGESDMALAGGVNLILNTPLSIAYSKGRMLSPEGRCKFGDAKANGFVRGEGCGVVILKQLSRALEDGDRIYGLIKGSAVNNDGRIGHFLAPSPEGQAAVQRQAYFDAGVEPSQVRYIEAHGTGTAVGDPVEIETLNKVMGKKRPTGSPCLMGSVKTNFGHLEAASGIAGLIKAALCLHHRQIPPSLHFDEPNPAIHWNELKVKIQKDLIPLGAGPEPITIGVNAFGLTGMNAHIVLQEFLSKENEEKCPDFNSSNPPQVYLLPFSTKSRQSLTEAVKHWHNFLGKDNPGVESLYDVCYTASLRRTHHDHRLAVVSKDRAEFIEKLGRLQNEANSSEQILGQNVGHGENRLAFVFSGQGPQWFAMGRQLLEQEPVYRKAVEECSEVLGQFADWSLLEEVMADQSCSRMDQTEFAQPSLFALQMALAALWESWGIRPDTVVGHSIGEVAASCYSGVLSLQDAVRVVYHRGRLLQQATGHGRMAAVEMSMEEVKEIISNYEGRVSVAAVNSPTSVTLSGETVPLEEVLKSLEKRNIFCRMLQVNYAFHSRQIEPYQQEMRLSVEGICPKPARIPILSTVTGKAAVEEDYGSAYWAENIRRPVQFAGAIDALIQKGHRTFLELGPHPVLGASIAQCLAHRELKGTLLASLRRQRGEKETMLEALSALYVQGRPIDWKGLYPQKGHCISLPAYPWQKKRYWIPKPEKPPERRVAHINAQENEGHPLAGRRLLSPALKDHVFEFILNIDSMPFLSDHRVYGEVILPAPVIMETALSAARAAFGDEFRVLKDFRIQRSLLFDGRDNKTLQVILKPEGEESVSFEVLNLLTEPGTDLFSWENLAAGKIKSLKFDRIPHLSSSAPLRYTERLERCREQISVEEFYRSFDDRGVKLGPLFQAFESISRSEGEAVARIRLPKPLEIEAQHYQIHPVLLDACLQLLTVTWPIAEKTRTDKGLYMFFSMDRFQQHSHAKPSPLCYAAVQSRSQSEEEMHFGDAQLFNEEGICVAEAKGICLKRASREALILARSRGIDASLFKVVWHPSAQFDQMRDRLAPTYLGSPKYIAEQLQKSDIAVQSNDEGRLRGGLLPQLDRLCTFGILRAFHQLGWEMTIGELVGVENLTTKLGMADRHRRLLARMFEMLQEDGMLKTHGSQWEVIRAPEIGDPQETLSLLSERYPEYDIELTVLRNCLENLPGVLRGELDAVNLLFPNGSVTMAEKMYQDAPLSRRINALVRKMISIVAEQVPEGSVIRILEIGGGTGGTTAHVLPELPPHRAEYVFTDISNFFLDKAREKFRECSFMSYRILDIEKEPEKQGIVPHHFDLVLASNVVHATADLRQTLQHISRILVPDGLLLLVEGVRPARWIDMIFGLTTGWWRFVDTDLRPNHPLLTRSKWIEVLSDEHFREVAVVPPGEGELGGVFEQAVIIARGPVLAEFEAAHEIETSLLDGFLKQLGKAQGSWLIFADQSGIGADLAETLQARGEFCTLVYPGQTYEILPDGRCRINPMQAEDYKLLARDFLGSGKIPCRAAIFLWGMDAELLTVTLSDLEKAAASACSSLVYLINALTAVDEVQPPRIWIATRGAQSLSQKEAPQLGQAPLWGMGRVVAVEHPDLWGGLIDLDPNGTRNEAVLNLLDHICRRDGENQALVRANRNYVPCLVPWGELAENPLPWDPEGNYLITGGLGDLGLQTARWMVEQGARRLILLGRTPLPGRTDWNHLGPGSPHLRRISVIQSLEASGACVKTGSVDVADEEQLRSFLEQLRTDGWTPIRGVIHTAAVAKDALLSQFDAAGFQQVWRPKAAGAWLLHRLLEGEPLDFFILFSSLGSLLGQTGQGSYAAANAFLDALANRRRAHGQPAMSVNWGSWTGSGLAITPGGKRTIQNLSLHGIEGISPQKATEAMGVLMQGRATQAAVLGVNWSRFRAVHPSDTGHLTLSQWTRHWIKTVSPPASGEKEKEGNLVRDQLLAAEQGPQRRGIMESYLSETLAGVLKLDVSVIDPNKPFGEMGLDSLMALEMKNRCERGLELKLSTSLAWNHPTIHFLATYLSEKLGVPLDEPDQYDAGGTDIDRLITDELREVGDTGVLGSVDKLSDEEALQALLRKAKS
jgi:acyl transferase domain-containing protein/SAM-dependent methyltransferase/acyl carrier protein